MRMLVFLDASTRSVRPTRCQEYKKKFPLHEKIQSMYVLCIYLSVAQVVQSSVDFPDISDTLEVNHNNAGNVCYDCV